MDRESTVSSSIKRTMSGANGGESGTDARASPESSITEKQATTPTKGRNWSITLNNPTEEEILKWKTATEHHWVKEARGQLERGETGTLHIQGMLKTEPVAWTRIKRLFPRAHVERATNVFALERYVAKTDTRVAPLGTQVAPVRKVITPQMLQASLAACVYDRVLHKGLPLAWAYRERGPSMGWGSAFWETPDDWETLELWQQMQRVLRLNKTYIDKHADDIITEAVDRLVVDGVLGAEYVTAQVASRAALKRHLSSIVIRHEKQRAEETYRQQAACSPRDEETVSVLSIASSEESR